MRLLCGVATGLFYGENEDGGSFGLFGSAAGATRVEPPRPMPLREALPGSHTMGDADGSRGEVARGRKFPENFAEQPDSPELLLGPRHRKNHLSTFGDFTYQVGLRSRRRGYLIHSMLIPATLAGSLQGEPKTHNGQMPTQLNPKKVLLCKN